VGRLPAVTGGGPAALKMGKRGKPRVLTRIAGLPKQKDFCMARGFYIDHGLFISGKTSKRRDAL